MLFMLTLTQYVCTRLLRSTWQVSEHITLQGTGQNGNGFHITF